MSRQFFKWVLVVSNLLLISLAIAGISLSYLVVVPVVQQESNVDLGEFARRGFGSGSELDSGA